MDGKLIAFAIVGLLVGIGAGVGAGFMLWNGDAADGETYSFYLHFGADDRRNGWYSAEGADALEGFDKAMEKAGFKWDISSLGYVASIDGKNNGHGWSIFQYLFQFTDKAAAEGSVAYPVFYDEGETMFGYSNGWKSTSGYDWGEDMKIGQFNSSVFFLAPYNTDYSSDSPVSITVWMTTGPFAA